MVMLGRMVGVQRAGKMLPEPGGPCIRKLQPQFHGKLSSVPVGCDNRQEVRTRRGHVGHDAALSHELPA